MNGKEEVEVKVDERDVKNHSFENRNTMLLVSDHPRRVVLI